MNRVQTLKHPKCPQWLKDADWEGNVSICEENFYITWKGGIWEGGTWKGGVWEDGTWKGGTWEGGFWKFGIWKGGVWKDGLWKGGVWKGGIWERGFWERGFWKGGTWKSGSWKSGFWEGGTWEGGFWKGGIWKDGHIAVGKCKWRCYYNLKEKTIKIGCENRPVGYWDDFFSEKCSSFFETPRDSEQFKEIKKCYLLAKTAIELEHVH